MDFLIKKKKTFDRTASYDPSLVVFFPAGFLVFISFYFPSINKEVTVWFIYG